MQHYPWLYNFHYQKSNLLFLGGITLHGDEAKREDSRLEAPSKRDGWQIWWLHTWFRALSVLHKGLFSHSQWLNFYFNYLTPQTCELSFSTCISLRPPPRSRVVLIRSAGCLSSLTFLSGYYGFIETSSPRRTGDKAVLTSMQFDATTGNGRCFSFWYHMYGSSIGKLNVFVKTFVGTTVTGTRLLWQLQGNQRNQWLQGRIPLRIGTSYQVNETFSWELVSS